MIISKRYIASVFPFGPATRLLVIYAKGTNAKWLKGICTPVFLAQHSPQKLKPGNNTLIQKR